MFFARFLPVVRTLTPAAAGTSGLPFRGFLPAVVAGAACWSAMHISIGAALGEAAKRIEGALNVGGFVVIGAVILVVVIVAIVKKRRAAKATAEPEPELEPVS